MTSIDSYNNKMASIEGGYKSNPMNAKGLMNDTFGVIKNNIYDALQNAVGFDPNVSIAFLKQLENPNAGYSTDDGRVVRMHPGVGMIQAYNEVGNPCCGAYSFHTIG